MRCFGCCEEDDLNKPADGGGHHMVKHSAGNNGGYPTTESASKAQAVKVQPIAVPAIPVNELKEVTDNFGTNSSIRRGHYHQNLPSQSTVSFFLFKFQFLAIC